MRISNHSGITQNPFTYCCTLISSFSRKTLNPQILYSAVPSISHRTISSLHNSSTGSSSFFSSELFILQKKTFLSNSSSGSYSVFCLESYALRKKQSFTGYLSGSVSNCCPNPYLRIKTPFLIKSSSWISSRCEIGSCSRYKHQSSCYFSFGLRSLDLSKPNSFYIRRCFTVSSSDGTPVNGPVMESEIQSVSNINGDQRKSWMRNNDPSNFLFEIVDILRKNGEDLESRLSTSRFSVYSILEIFKVLNNEGISGLRFFEWIWFNNPQLRRNANVCSLIVDNFGRLDDYETMLAWLKTFTFQKVCLTYEAFLFLPVLASSNSLLNETTQKVVDLLNKVGGSCRNSGICALIEMFCKLDLFEMARHVIKITENKNSYYCLMIREKCKNGLIQDAYGIIREMQETHCEPNTTMYNYILGSLCKNGKTDEAYALLNEMNGVGIPSDAITFEIQINFICKLGKLDDVRKVLDEMMSQGIEPRPTTHACIVKALFAAEKYEAAHKHVVDLSFKTSRNMMYSLMANLYREKGDIMSAGDVLVEMMDKCLKPNFRVYVKIVKQLRRIKRGNLARNLESRQAKFVIKSQA